MRYRIIKTPIWKATEEESFFTHKTVFGSNSKYYTFKKAAFILEHESASEYSVLEIGPEIILMVSLRTWLDQN